MTFKTALRARLKAAPGLTAVTIDWARRPQGRYPAIVLTIVSDPITRHMTGVDGWRQPRVQADVFGLDASAVVTLRDAYLAAIAPSTSAGGVRFGPAQQMRAVDLSEETDTDFVFREMIEAVMPHQLEN